MISSLKKIAVSLMAASLLFSSMGSALAQSGGASSDVMNQVVEQNSILLQLKEKLAQIQYRYTLLKDNVDVAEKNLEEATEAITNITAVLTNLDAQIADTTRQGLNVKSQKESKKMELEKLEKDAEGLAAQLEDQKKVVASLTTLLYVKRGVYYDEDGVNPVKVLASPNTVSQTLQQLTYMKLVEAQNQAEMEKADELSTELANKWDEIRIKQGELDEVDIKVTTELENLEKEREHQQNLLDETVGEKSILEAMLATTDSTQGDLESQIRIYQNNIDMIEQNLVEQGGLLSEDQKATVEQIQADMAATYSTEEASQFLQLDWPVSPSLGVSAFFHDGGYQAQFGVDHYAVDIRQKQGSEIHAPADGVVQNVVFDPNSTRYAYIMIAHRMGVITVYGHISSPAVAIGDYVTRGQLIGYTGGDPHSVGSGERTTGPHLHFEVWQDGVRVDPLKYLPLSELDVSDLPAEYMQQVQKALEAQIKNFGSALNQ
jgi:murein DD-endopeptidase MepM/ murein hydrolase activator NlpD